MSRGVHAPGQAWPGSPPGGGECTPAQVDIWLAERLGDLGPRYHLAFGFRLRGDLDTAALERACRALLRRHPILLTRYPERAGEPVRLPVPESRWRLERLAGSGGDDPAVRRWLAARFDLAAGPLLRTGLLATGPDQWLLLFACHHLIFDGSSRDLVAADLAALYAEQRRATAARLPPVPEYERFVAWQREQARWPAVVPELWRATAALARDPARLPDAVGDLGGDRAGGLHAELTVPAPVRDRLAGIAKRAGGSLFGALLASVTVLLDKYYCGSGGTPPPVTVPCDQRPAGYASSVGLFATELPFRCPPAPTASFGDHLAATVGRLRHTLSLRSVPISALIRGLDGGGTGAGPLHRPAVAAVGFGYRRTRPAPAWDGVEVEFVPWLPVPASRAEVEVQLLDDGRSLTGWLAADPERFGAGGAGEMAAHWRRVLGWVGAAPRRRLAELCLLDAPSRHRVTVGWNQTARPLAEATLPELLRAQARAAPHATAVVDDATGTTLTYAELHRRANHLAHRLRALGAGPEGLVAVCLPRCPELVVALLGAMKAGAAYLPLDPDHPLPRLWFQLRDSRAAVLVTNSGLATQIAASAGVDGGAAGEEDPPPLSRIGPENTVLLEPPDTGTDVETSEPEPRIGPGDPAYALYTSGSTGTPKAVLVEHRAIVNRLQWAQRRYGLTSQDRVLQKTSVGFDVSGWELWWPLLTGAGLVLAVPGGHRDPGYLTEVVNRAGVSTLHFVPAMLEAFLDHPDSAGCVSLRRVLCSGEELAPGTVRRFADRLPATELHNLYGPTEAAIDVSSWQCRPGPEPPADRVPIGHPIDNTRLYILDRDMQPVPVGVAGELYLGGVNLARGYLHRPALTGQRFVPNPLAGEGTRMYRTGDLARYRPDGAVEFLGRVDHQVKIRGNRVEPGEIEAVLREHPEVAHVVVALRDGAGPDGPALVGYVVADRDAGTDSDSGTDSGAATEPAGGLPERLTALVRGRLPEYMWPVAILVLDRLPLTSNGKLDRAALPVPPPPDPARDPDQAPTSGSERLVATVWGELFGVARLGPASDFFDLGGHSLLATRTVARLRDAAGVELPMRVVFEHPTVRELAAAVDQAGACQPAPPTQDSQNSSAESFPAIEPETR